MDHVKHKYSIFVTVLIIFVYLILRLGWSDTVEFWYDQPRLSFVVQDFLHTGTYLNSQQFALESPFGNFSWGPALVYLYAPIIMFANNPLTASLAMGLINVLSVLIIMYVGWRFFSPTVGLVSGLILATQPWWVIFSRMVYQPTPVVSLVALTILVTFLFLEKPRSIWLVFVIFMWGVLFQVYLNAISIIVSSAVSSLINFKRIKWQFLVTGIILLIFLFLPSAYYYANHPNMFQAFGQAPKNFNPHDSSVVARVSNVAKSYFEVISGSGFTWELGNGYADFLHQIPMLPLVASIVEFIFLITILFETIIIFKKDQTKKLFRILILFWTVGPLWFLSLVAVPDLVPRYFLVCLPGLSLLFGLFIQDILYLLKRLNINLAKIIFVIPMLISVWWIFLQINYYNFLESYNYPQGLLSNFSDIPYHFLDESFKWIMADAKSNNIDNIVFSTSPTATENFSLNQATSYYWEYVLHKNYAIDNSKKTGFYFILVTSQKPVHTSLQQFGPYTVYRYK